VTVTLKSQNLEWLLTDALGTSGAFFAGEKPTSPTFCFLMLFPPVILYRSPLFVGVLFHQKQANIRYFQSLKVLEVLLQLRSEFLPICFHTVPGSSLHPNPPGLSTSDLFPTAQL